MPQDTQISVNPFAALLLTEYQLFQHNNYVLYIIRREEQRLRMSENRVLRRIFGPNRDEMTGGWRKLHKVELQDVYFSPSKIRMINSRRMRWAGYVARMGEKTNGCRILV
jgi:hypothetical protein